MIASHYPHRLTRNQCLESFKMTMHPVALTHQGQRCYASVVEEQSGDVVLDVFRVVALDDKF